MIRGWLTTFALLGSLFLGACALGPDQVHWGEEECAHCHMSISDERYAAQLVDARGKTWKFDAIECMAAFMADNADLMNGHSAWIASGPAEWVPAGEAYFVQSEQIRSPMGAGIAAFPTLAEAEAAAGEVAGTLQSWEDVLAGDLRSMHSHGGS